MALNSHGDENNKIFANKLFFLLLLAPFLLGNMIVGIPMNPGKLDETINPSEKFFIRNIHSFNTYFSGFGIVGALFGAYLTDMCGRRYTTMFFTQFMIFGNVLKIISSHIHFSIFSVGRIFDGFSSGALMVSAVVWLLEIVPQSQSSYYKLLIQVYINLGIFVMRVLQTLDVFREKVYVSFYLPIAGSILLTISTFLIPESYKFIYSKTKNIEKAKNILKLIRTNDLIDNEIQILQRNDNENKISFNKFFSTKKFIAATASWSIVNFGKQIIGINYFMTFNIYQTQNKALYDLDNIAFLIFSLISFVGSLIFFIVGQKGHRKLFMEFGYCFYLIFLSLSLICFSWKLNKYIGFAFKLAVVFSYQFGPGPIPWFICSEIFPSSYFGVSQGVTTSFSWIGETIIYLIIPFANSAFGIRCLYIFVIFTILMIIFQYFMVGETYGKEIGKIQQSYLQSWQKLCYILHIPIHVTNLSFNPTT